MNGGKFHLEINCIEDFVCFVALIRNEEIDLEKLQKFTKDLNKSDKSLEDAIKNQGEK